MRSAERLLAPVFHMSVSSHESFCEGCQTCHLGCLQLLQSSLLDQLLPLTGRVAQNYNTQVVCCSLDVKAVSLRPPSFLFIVFSTSS